MHLPHSEGPNIRLHTPPMLRRPTSVKPLLETLGTEISEAEDSPEEGEKTATVERKVSIADVQFHNYGGGARCQK